MILAFFLGEICFSSFHRIKGVGRNLWKSSRPTPYPLKQILYSRLHRKASRQVVNISREGDSADTLGSLFQCSEGSSRDPTWNMIEKIGCLSKDRRDTLLEEYWITLSLFSWVYDILKSSFPVTDQNWLHRHLLE